MDMIERVARKWCEYDGGGDKLWEASKDWYIDGTKLLLTEMMEPTEEMVAAGRPVDHMALRSVDSIYNAMIRAALEEGK